MVRVARVFPQYNNPKFYLVLLTDALLIYLSYRLAYLLRFEGNTEKFYPFFKQTVLPIVALKLTMFSYFGLESGMWRFTSLVDLINIFKAAFASFMLIMAGLIYLYYPHFVGNVSRSVFILDMLLTIFLIGAFRLSIRMFYTRFGRSSNLARDMVSSLVSAKTLEGGGVPALIYGANERADQLLRALMNPSEGGRKYKIAGLIDDNRWRAGMSIHGYEVLGTLKSLPALKERYQLKELLVTERLDGERLEAVNETCQGLNLKLKVIPSYFDESRDPIGSQALRELDIEDLLFREPATADFTRIEQALKGKNVMITGAGGSIGGEMCRLLARFSPKALVFVDLSENYLHELECSLAEEGRERGIAMSYYCADVTDEAKMRSLFALHRPHYVFHAAAHKHVPMMERNKDKAIRNNLKGVKVAADLAEEFGAERFTLISTDKAVNPANIMGATKRVCELYVRHKAARCKTLFLAVRFGNVLGSNGSVIPLFMRQIKNRGPVTVTHPDIERYFMTIHEAVLLVLQASALEARQGGLFALDMGKPVRILHLAEKMIRLMGFVPHTEIEIAYTGLREGEKLYEELVGEWEKTELTHHKKILRIADENPGKWDGVEPLVDRWIEECSSRPDDVAREIYAFIANGGGATVKN